MDFIILFTGAVLITIMFGLFFLITSYKRIFDQIENPLYFIVVFGLLLLSNPFIGITVLCIFPLCYNNYEQQLIHQIEYQHNIEDDDDDEEDDDEEDDEEDEEDDEEDEEEDEEENDEEDNEEENNIIDPDDILPENTNIPSDSEEPQQHSNPVVEHLDESIDNEFRRSIEDNRELKRRRIGDDIKNVANIDVLETEYISDFFQSLGAKSNAPAPAPIPMIERPSNPNQIEEHSNTPSPELPELPIFYNTGPSTELPTLDFQTLSELKSLPESPIEEKNVQMEETKENETKENETKESETKENLPRIISTATHIGCGLSCVLCIIKICL